MTAASVTVWKGNKRPINALKNPCVFRLGPLCSAWPPWLSFIHTEMFFSLAPLPGVNFSAGLCCQPPGIPCQRPFHYMCLLLEPHLRSWDLQHTKGESDLLRWVFLCSFFLGFFLLCCLLPSYYPQADFFWPRLESDTAFVLFSLAALLFWMFNSLWFCFQLHFAVPAHLPSLAFSFWA